MFTTFTFSDFNKRPLVPIKYSKRLIIASLLLLFCLCQALPVFAAEAANPEQPISKKKVLFIPFHIEIPGSYAYLQNGLTSVLSSRVASRADIIALSQNAATRQMAQYLRNGRYGAFGKLLHKSKADYLVIGSLSPKKEHFQLVTYVFFNSGQPPKVFVSPMDSLDEAMQTVDKLAWDISGDIFGKAQPSQVPKASQQSDGMTAFQTAHPERAYKEGIFKGTEHSLETGNLFELVTTRRSRKIQAEVMDINSGDLDGDGQDEIILLTNSELLIYRYSNERFQQVTTIDLVNYLRMHAVTLGDFNNNNILEMYISGNNRDNPSSMVIEWDGKNTSFLHKDISYYLRAFTIPGAPSVLAGQVAPAEGPSGGSIYTFRLDDTNRLIRQQILNIPTGLNIYDFSWADLNGDGTRELITINRKNKLQVYNHSGALAWTSSDTYGASKNFFGTLITNSQKNKLPTFLSTRIIVRDLDQDGNHDIIVGRNRVDTVTFMPRLRYFEGSSIAALKWEENALTPLWETQKIAGYTVNSQIINSVSQQPDNQFELLFAEGNTSYPFAFWQVNSTVLHTYTIKLNTP